MNRLIIKNGMTCSLLSKITKNTENYIYDDKLYIKKHAKISDIWIATDLSINSSLLILKHSKKICALKINLKDKKVYLNLNTLKKNRSLKEQRQNIPIDFENLKKDMLINGYDYHEIETATESVVYDHHYPQVQGLRTKIGNCNSKRIALLEYIERACAFTKPSRIITDNYKKLNKSHNVIHPKSLGYNWANNSLDNFNDDSNIQWIPSYSLYSSEEFLIPLQFANYNFANIVNRFIEGNSNGCALGSSIMEANLFGLLEFIERDTFIGYWFFDQFKIFELEYSTLDNANNYKLYMKAKGYTLRFFYIENIIGLYTIWCLATNEKDNDMYSVSGLACKFDLKDAIRCSFEEMCSVLLPRESEITLKEKIKNVENKKNIKDVSTIDSIIYYYASEKLVKENMQYDLKSVSKIEYRDLDQYSLYSDSIEGDLNNLLESVRTRYNDVIYSDLTPIFLKKYNLYCVKVTGIGGYDLQFSVDENHRPTKFNRSPILPIA